MRQRLLMAFIALAVVVIAIGAYFYSRGAATPPPTPGVKTGQALIGGPFALVDQEGKRVTDQDFRGRFMLVYFGYTHCPDQCPLDLDTMTQALDQMPADLSARVQPVFITVDPTRDTQAVMHDYAGHFHPRLEALTGSADEVDAAEGLPRLRPQGPPGDGRRRRLSRRPLRLHLPDGPRRPLPRPLLARHQPGRHGQAPRLARPRQRCDELTPRPCGLARLPLHLRDRHTLAARARSSIG